MSFSTNRINMDGCQRKVENVFGSLQNDWIVIRSIMLWKEPASSFIVFVVLNIISSCYIPGAFRCICYIVCCVVLLFLSLLVSLKNKLGDAIEIGKTSLEKRKRGVYSYYMNQLRTLPSRFEEETLSYQRLCSIIAPVLKFVDPHREQLKKLVDTCLAYFLQIDYLISLPLASVLVLLSLMGIIHFLAVLLWLISLCSLWMPWQYYGIHSIICEIDKQLSSSPEITYDDPPAFKGSIPPQDTFICSNYLMGRCQAYECSMHHVSKPYQWIYLYESKWWIMNEEDDDRLETCFCTPLKTNPELCLTLERVTFAMSESYTVDFNSMTVCGESNIYPIKRLSTMSQVQLPGCPVATKWCWYWKNEKEIFVEYQFNLVDASRELEKQFLKGETTYDFQVANRHSYTLYFRSNPMYQKNITFGTQREVQRRPFLNKIGQYTDQCARFLIWEIMEKKKKAKWVGNKNIQEYMRVKLTRSQKEYRDIKSLFKKTMHETPTIKSIERLENQSIWEKYSSTKSQMTNCGNDANEHFLFHGTKQESVEGIYMKNFDWRMSGTSTGSIYGEGTYFAIKAEKSHSYTAPDSNGYRYMFVALVLVGSYTKGERGLRIPPPKDSRNPRGDTFDSCVDSMENPKIIVIFDKNQCYPAYLIKYRV